MTYTYSVGEKVAVDHGRHASSWRIDTVKRITDASVITEDGGAFRRKGMDIDGRCTKNVGDSRWSQFVTLYPMAHPTAARGIAEFKQRQRQRRRDQATRCDAVAIWVQTGTDAALANAIEAIAVAQQQYGESMAVQS